jgi:hypothetical protein
MASGSSAIVPTTGTPRMRRRLCAGSSSTIPTTTNLEFGWRSSSRMSRSAWSPNRTIKARFGWRVDEPAVLVLHARERCTTRTPQRRLIV